MKKLLVGYTYMKDIYSQEIKKYKENNTNKIMRYLFLTNQRKSNKKKIYYIILYFYFVDRGIEPPIAGEPRTPESFRFFFPL